MVKASWVLVRRASFHGSCQTSGSRDASRRLVDRPQGRSSSGHRLSRIDQRDVALLLTEPRALLMERARRGTGR